MKPDNSGRVSAWAAGALLLCLSAGLALATSSRGRLSAAPTGANDPAAGFTSNGSTTTTTQAARVMSLEVTGTTGPAGTGIGEPSGNVLGLYTTGVSRVTIHDTAMLPTTDGTLGLGTTASQWVNVFTDAVTLTRKSLATCATALEGRIEVDVLSGLATGKRTKACLCTSDGASAFVWQNMVTGTLGTTTTCGTE